MLVCTKCQLIMKCIKNGISCDFGNGVTYPGDLFQCPVCKQSTIKTNDFSAHDPNYKFSDHYLPMKSAKYYDIDQNEIDSYLEKHFTKPIKSP